MGFLLEEFCYDVSKTRVEDILKSMFLFFFLLSSLANAQTFKNKPTFRVYSNTNSGDWSIMMLDGERQIKSEPIAGRSKEDLEDLAYQATVYSKLGLYEDFKGEGTEHFMKDALADLRQANTEATLKPGYGFAEEIVKMHGDLQLCKGLRKPYVPRNPNRGTQ